MARSGAQATRDFIEIDEIRDGVLLLRDKSLRAVLMASSINFALKSNDEQDAIVLQYQNFLNSLDFSVEFFVQSRKLNIEPYLDTLRERQKGEFNELMKIQISEYIEFVKTFVDSANIVSKSFYVIIPFSPLASNKSEGLKSVFSSITSHGEKKTLDDSKFQEYKTQLYQRVDAVRQGLIRTGVRMVPLNTEELIELYYGLYNPGELEKGKIPEIPE
ncbi:MAG: hypothetical protein A2756_06395 [Candidatus Ryanbacteria bacterium RIFCSPHIGHO2_01_FULL_48_27]|uniref:TraC-like domain-containing protein n=1 Tax=Candidatus Ryanbacteria bacterium RIFCSPHIGHO2_01_FULL_48_27 TaxID=1802115 RepID=A0A1G2G7H3_9BACT|nr:MAG: hypothetical protein A2756_06395 [Candidatus Ryanbacteria bacterium RIFCSPHIGHO2_01_FULL_48_27]